MSIPVICDRCRSTGTAGTSDFSHLGDLLDFEPVPVRPRPNGWDPDAQRAFIALLSSTGSKRRSALAIGRNAYGIDQLMKRPDAASFNAAVERALAIFKQHGAMKIASGVADAAARNAQLTPPSRLRGAKPPPEPAISEDQHWDLLQNIGLKFMRKVAAEREARLAGQVVAADFYLRQITFMEVLFDLTAATLGFDPGEILHHLRRGPHLHRDIVSTPFSDWLDRSRRQWWAQEGEPERPQHPDVRFLERRSTEDGECATYTEQSATGAITNPARGYSQEQWAGMSHDEQREARKRQFAEDAVAQMEWEAGAREAWEASERSAQARAGFDVSVPRT